MDWKPDVEEWEKVPLEAYQFVFEQTKERFNELVTESEVITNRAMSILLIYIAAISATLGYLLSKDATVSTTVKTLLIISIGLIAPVIWLALKLVAPRETYYKGNTPKQLFRNEAFQGYSEKEGTLGLYYNELIIYQKRIAFLEKQNKERIESYNYVRLLSLAILCLSILTLVISLI